jgi:hypothetical protein
LLEEQVSHPVLKVVVARNKAPRQVPRLKETHKRSRSLLPKPALALGVDLARN